MKVPDNLPLDGAAPLLCAGITVYSPMKHFGMTRKGAKLGVVGLGGLGHMAVKFGKAFGLEVTIISTSPHKEKEALEILGADHFLVSKDPQQLKVSVESIHEKGWENFFLSSCRRGSTFGKSRAGICPHGEIAFKIPSCLSKRKHSLTLILV